MHLDTQSKDQLQRNSGGQKQIFPSLAQHINNNPRHERKDHQGGPDLSVRETAYQRC